MFRLCARMASLIVFYYAGMGQMLDGVCVCVCVCVCLCGGPGRAALAALRWSLDGPTVIALPKESQGMAITDENKLHTQLTCHLASVCKVKQ